MRNMKVSRKLILSFTILAILTAIVGVTGIIGMRIIENVNIADINRRSNIMPPLAGFAETLQRARVSVREVIMGATTDDDARIDEAFAQIGNYMEMMEIQREAALGLIAAQDVLELFQGAWEQYQNELVPVVVSIHTASQARNFDEIFELLDDCIEISTQIENAVEYAITLVVGYIQESVDDAAATTRYIAAISIIAIVIAVLISLFFGRAISGMISRPIGAITSFLKRITETGEIAFNQSEMETINKYKHNKDELGVLSKTLENFKDALLAFAEVLNIVSKGDLSVEAEAESDKDILSNSLNEVIRNLNVMLSEIQNATSQVALGSQQVADDSQILAQGSSDQASSIEELSVAISEISRKTKDNAGRADNAAALAADIKKFAEMGNTQMGEMTSAVADINQSSQSIGKVIKIIDDIAFQTNILALNASVEAARAGQHGKGFAVVAEEVRNLAARSAEAAKDTSKLISDSIEKAELGSKIAENTACSFSEIVSGINESGKIISEIARSSNEQSQGVIEINKNVEQVAKVVQQTSSTAQQSASASQEMSSQSTILEGLVSQFKIKGGGQKLLP